MFATFKKNFKKSTRPCVQTASARRTCSQLKSGIQIANAPKVTVHDNSIILDT